MTNLRFGEILEKYLSISKEELDKALKFQQEYGGKLGEILLNSGILSEEQIAAALAIQFGIKEVKDEIKDFSKIDLAPVKEIDPDWFIVNEIIPLFLREDNMFFLIKDPLNIYPVEAVTYLYSEYTVTCLLSDERQYREVLNFFKMKYTSKGETAFDENEIEKLRDMAGEAPIIKFVNSMITRAAEYRASDIHVENENSIIKIRYRIDGVLHDVDMASSDIAPAIISRLKIMSNLDIGEKRLPQDGRIQLKVSGRLYDIRISTIPSIHGENIVMRLLEKENVNYSIDTLGLEEKDSVIMNELARQNFGLVLVTGPTGSGKSTTLYSVLSSLNIKEKKIITVEDPVEYQIPGITQIHVHEQIGLTFASILRNILRQDPDIVMIGEIRDQETAEIAIQASLTGHLVLATLHTNDSISAITRLSDMGVDDYLINSSLLGVIAQRLIRKICPHCAEETTYDENMLGRIDLPEILKKYKIKKPKIRKGTGCDECAHTGYRERMGIFEMLKYTDDMKSLILKGKDYEQMKNALAAKHFKTLREDAILKWLKGYTTIEEVFRVT